MSNTTCALINLHDSVTRYLDNPSSEGIALISYDFSKAFDTIPHDILLLKTIQLGFPSGFIYWLKDYLDNREQCVRINGVRSDFLPVTSGAPQGSILGPFLFLIMCYDFHPIHDSTVIIQYADDITEGCPIYSSDLQAALLRDEFEHILQWSSRNGFTLNANKTKCILLWKKARFYDLNLPFEVSDHLKLLGVIWCDTLSWDVHFSDVEAKCSRRLYILRVLKRSLSHDELWTVYYSLIENLILYACEFFGPLSYVTKTKIDRIFRRAKLIICPSACVCNNINTIDVKRKKRTIDLLSRSREPGHPLRGTLPPVGRANVIVPSFRTIRRRNCFTVYSSILAGNVRID